MGTRTSSCVQPRHLVSCVKGVTTYTPDTTKQAEIQKKCIEGGMTTDTAKACTDRDGGCVATQTKKKAAEVAAVPAKCVAKTCANYIKDKATCEGASIGCVYTAKKDGVAGTTKCASKDGNEGDKKKACDAAKTKCTDNANGGLGCCGVVVDKKGSALVPATCVKKDSNAAMAVTSAFAAAAAALLM